MSLNTSFGPVISHFRHNPHFSVRLLVCPKTYGPTPVTYFSGVFFQPLQNHLHFLPADSAPSKANPITLGSRGPAGRGDRCGGSAGPARPSPLACGALRPRRGRALRPLGQVSQQLSLSLSPQRHRGPTAPQGRPGPSPRARGPEAAAAPTLLFTSMVPRPRLPAAPPR